MDDDIAYLAWHEAHGDADHDLATSDQWPVAGDWDVLPGLLADRPDPPAGTTLADQLAALYDVPAEQVLVTVGGTGANVAAFAAAAAGASEDDGGDAGENGDADAGGDDGRPTPRVLVEAPGYEPLRATPAWFGAAVDRYRRPVEDGCPLEPARIEAAGTDATTLVVATNRHNPSGRRVDRETLATAAEAAAGHDARLLVDEVYAPFGAEPTEGPFGGPTAAGIDGTVVTSSLTKFFGLGGLRVGWLIADPPFVERARAALRHFPSVATPSRALARRALHHREAIAERAREHCRANYRLLADFVDAREDLVGPVYEGSTYAFLAHVADPDDARGGDDPVEYTHGDDVAEAAAAHDCTVVPGRFFERTDRFRVSLGGPQPEMAAALSALGEALDDC